MSSVYGKVAIAEGVDACGNNLTPAVGALDGEANHADQSALSNAEGDRGIFRLGTHRQGFGEPDFAPGTGGAIDTEALRLNDRRVGGRQPRSGRGKRFQLIILSESGRCNQQKETEKEDPTVFHGDWEGRIWSGRPDSNRRHRPWQGRTLPAELLPLNVKPYFYAET